MLYSRCLGKVEKNMEIMRTNLLKLVSSGLTATAVMPYIAWAQGKQPAPTPITTLPGVLQAICTAVDWIFTFLIIIAIIFVLVAAFKYLTAGGDPEKVKSASHNLIYAAVAVAIGIIAQGVPLIVITFFTGVSFTGCT